MRHLSLQEADRRRIVMRWRADVAIRILTLLVLWVSPLSLFAQTPKPPSLKEQLEAQYAPGTVLVIQKAGILGVPPASTRMCASKYQDGNLKPPDVACSAPLKNSSRPFPVGEKVNPSEIRVNFSLPKATWRRAASPKSKTPSASSCPLRRVRTSRANQPRTAATCSR